MDPGGSHEHGQARRSADGWMGRGAGDFVEDGGRGGGGGGGGEEGTSRGRGVGVLMGGWGEEREISLKTGEAVVAALEAQGHTVTRVFAGPGLDRALRSAELDVAFLALHGRMGEDGKVQGLLEVL